MLSKNSARTAQTGDVLVVRCVRGCGRGQFTFVRPEDVQDGVMTRFPFGTMVRVGQLPPQVGRCCGLSGKMSFVGTAVPVQYGRRDVIKPKGSRFAFDPSAYQHMRGVAGMTFSVMNIPTDVEYLQRLWNRFFTRYANAPEIVGLIAA